MTTEDFIVLIMENVEDDSTRKTMYEQIFDKLSSSAKSKLHHLIGDDDVLDDILEADQDEDDDKMDELWSEDSDF